MLRIAIGHVRAALLQLLEERREVDEVLPRGVGRELESIAIVLLEVLAVLLVEVLAIERARHGGVVGERNQLLAAVIVAAGVEEILEPDVLAIALGVLRQGLVAEEFRKVGIVVREGRADRLVLHIVQVEIGLAAAQVDADLLLHRRQLVGQNLDLNAGEIEKHLELLLDREGGRRVLRHEDQLGAAILLPLRVIGRRGVDRAAGDDRVQADRERARTERDGSAAAKLEKLAPADRLVERILWLQEHEDPPDRQWLAKSCNAAPARGRFAATGHRWAKYRGEPLVRLITYVASTKSVASEICQFARRSVIVSEIRTFALRSCENELPFHVMKP